MRREQACTPGPGDQLAAQRFVRAVRTLAWIGLERHHFRRNEFPDTLLQIAQTRFE